MDKEATLLLRSLLDPRVAEFIDWRKFFASPKFAQLGKDQIDHFIQHGDSSYIKRMLDQFKGHKSFKPMLFWFCDSAGLDFHFTGAELVLKRASCTRVIQGNLKDYMAKYIGTARDVGGIVPVVLTRQQEISKLFNPEGRRRGSPYLQGGAPGLGKRS
jgi:hypothetical protein